MIARARQRKLCASLTNQIIVIQTTARDYSHAPPSPSSPRHRRPPPRPDALNRRHRAIHHPSGATARNFTPPKQTRDIDKKPMRGHMPKEKGSQLASDSPAIPLIAHNAAQILPTPTSQNLITFITQPRITPSSLFSPSSL